MREATKTDGTDYWEYVLLYVDDCLVVSDHGEKMLRQETGKYFKLKQKSIGQLYFYLGGKMRLINIDNGSKEWALSSSQYVVEYLKNVEAYLARKVKKLNAKAGAPISNRYRLETESTDELQPVDAAYYQSLIGILRWIVDIGRVDICAEVSMLSYCLDIPREGYLQKLFHIFTYLKKHHKC